ncbi:MAG: hypothetical protein VB115_06400 [Christensenellaceae bacterium]|nr:hypothetical protein [Christensenellaceae bacterium]
MKKIIALLLAIVFWPVRKKEAAPKKTNAVKRRKASAFLPRLIQYRATPQAAQYWRPWRCGIWWG